MATTLLHPRAVGAAAPEMRLVTFSLGETQFAVDVVDVHGIYHGLPLIPTPDLSGFLDGEVQLADRRIPVVNLRRFAGLPEENDSTVRWILMVDDVRGPIGLIVDRVTEVVRLQPGALEAADAPAAVPVADYIVAAATLRDRPLYLPDLGRLVHDALSQAD